MKYPEFKITHRGRLINLYKIPLDRALAGPYERKDYDDIVLFWVEPVIEIAKKFPITPVYDLGDRLNLYAIAGFGGKPEPPSYSFTLIFDSRIRDEFDLPPGYDYTVEQEVRKLLRMASPVAQEIKKKSGGQETSSYAIGLPPCYLLTSNINSQGVITQLSITETILNNKGERIACQVNIEFTETEILEAMKKETVSSVLDNTERKIVTAKSDTFLIQLLNENRPAAPFDLNESILRTQAANPGLKLIVRGGQTITLVYYLLK